jgi:hypothetical protein
MKIFVNAINKDGDGVLNLKNKFPRICEAEIKEGILSAHKIKEVINYNKSVFIDKSFISFTLKTVGDSKRSSSHLNSEFRF